MAKSSKIIDGLGIEPEEGHHAAEPADVIDEATHESKPFDEDLVATAATVGIVGVGVVLFEAALLPGLVLGVCTMLVPKALPRIGSALNPIFKSTVRGAYKLGEKTKEMVAEMHEQVHDIVAEVHAEDETKEGEAKSTTRAPVASAA